MDLTRRQLLKAGLMAGAGLLLPFRWSAPKAFAQVPLDPRILTKYLDPLPVPGVLDGTVPQVVTMSEFTQQLHSQLSPTLVWGYNGAYPGPTIEAVRGTPLSVTWVNDLFSPSLLASLPVDQTLHWADPLGTGPLFTRYTGPVPTVTHLHGGETEPQSDGHPDAWYTPGLGITGPGVQGNLNVFFYNNAQEAATLWYHDHALGVTRLNVFAGLAAFYLFRDPTNEPAGLPGSPPDDPMFEREIVIQDRMFDVNGQLLFPSAGINPTVHPFWIPEFLGDTIVVNGAVWPFLNVEPRKYRFRFLNGSSARFYNLSLGPKLVFTQIGTDGGYLNAPVPLKELLIAPGERADVIVDFTGLAVGTQIVMTNDAKAPFPGGARPSPQTTGQIMQFRVVPLVAPDPSVIPANLRPNNPIVPLAGETIAQTRTLTLNELLGPGGPLALFLDGKLWGAPVSEMPTEGTTELWEIVNLTADTHPIHLHLVQFQLLNRQRFQLNRYLRLYNLLNPVIPTPAPNNPPVAPFLVGAPMPPPANEAGWKDTVRMNPGEVTRILVRFAPTDTPAGVMGTYPFNPSALPGYVWHCHILDHEDNEMMRPYMVM
jgi:spore coat protein A